MSRQPSTQGPVCTALRITAERCSPATGSVSTAKAPLCWPSCPAQPAPALYTAQCKVSRPGHSHSYLRLVVEYSQVKVTQLDVTRSIQEDVLQLHIPVCDTHGVHGRQGAQQGCSNLSISTTGGVAGMDWRAAIRCPSRVTYRPAKALVHVRERGSSPNSKATFVLCKEQVNTDCFEALRVCALKIGHTQ